MSRKSNKRIRIALAGNANVGKSVIFNQLTGLNQIVGNWPGKTVERAEGTLFFEGYKIHVIDLPGIYSLSTYSLEEIVSRDYIAVEKPDVIINVVDASTLERNLYFTIQLLELESPLILDLNQVDFAAKKGIRINVEKLSEILGVPVIPTVAIAGTGIKDVLSTVIDSKVKANPNGEEVVRFAEKLAKEIERIHGEPSHIVIAAERYNIANRIAQEVSIVFSPPKLTFEEKLDEITTHRVFGYLILAGVFAAIFAIIFSGGNFLASILEILFDDFIIPITEDFLGVFLPEIAVNLISNGIIMGIVAGITIALPYILPFYILLALLEDSGYLPRAAFLMDNLMHKIGLHGKAFIPLMLGYGCNVPACIGCRIMETERERFLAGFIVVLIPCAATTVVILGLVGRFIGLHAALALYAFDLILIFILGRIAFKTLPGEPVGLIMEMPPYKKPTIRNILVKTWSRTKDFVYVAFPIIIAGSFTIEALAITGAMQSIVNSLSPLFKDWLGLPAVAGIPLIFGILRKELTLILLQESLQQQGMTIQQLTHPQLIVFSLVTMIYIPCIATIAACIREFGLKKALLITFIDIGLAFLIGGIAFRLLTLTL